MLLMIALVVHALAATLWAAAACLTAIRDLLKQVVGGVTGNHPVAPH